VVYRASELGRSVIGIRRAGRTHPHGPFQSRRPLTSPALIVKNTRPSIAWRHHPPHSAQPAPRWPNPSFQRASIPDRVRNFPLTASTSTSHHRSRKSRTPRPWLPFTIGGDDTLSFSAALLPRAMPRHRHSEDHRTMNVQAPNTASAFSHHRAKELYTRQRTTLGSHETHRSFPIFGPTPVSPRCTPPT